MSGGFFQVQADASFENPVIMSVGHLPPYAPVATALNQSAGSDCGSSSGLGGMKDHSLGDDSGSNHSSAAESGGEGRVVVNGKPAGGCSSSKRSAASSSGKGSSTGASPTSGTKSAEGSPRHDHHNRFRHHQYHVRPPTPPSQGRQGSLKEGSVHSSGPSTSSTAGLDKVMGSSEVSTCKSSNGGGDHHSVSMQVSATNQGPLNGDPRDFPGPTINGTIVAVSGTGGDFGMPPPMGMSMVPAVGGGPHLHISPSTSSGTDGIIPVSAFPASGIPIPNNGPLYTMTVGSTGQFELHHVQNGNSGPGPNTAHFPPLGTCPPPLYSHTHHHHHHHSTVSSGGRGGGGPPPLPHQMTRSSCSSFSPSPACAAQQSNGGPLHPAGSAGDPGSSGAGSRGSTSPPVNAGQSGPQAFGAPPTVGQHAVYVHVNPGETLSVRVGTDIQHIPGPATVRMVSQNAGPPVPLPLHVPPGHIVQQIVDEQGTLRHLILSPQSPPVIANGPFPGGGLPPGGGPGGGGGVVVGVSPPPPCQQPGVPLGVIVDAGGFQVDHQPNEDFQMEFQPRSQWSPKVNRRPRQVAQAPMYGTSEDPQSDSVSSANDDDDADKIKEMLSSRIQPPSVSDIGPREAQVSWNALDTSEASASGGPFPYIDASEFTYEVLVFERRIDSQPVDKLRCQDQTYQWLCGLKPSTEYFVRLRAHLLDRKLSGEISAPIGFRTKPSHPDKPQPPRLQKRSKNWVTLAWKKPCENGSKILTYHLEVDEGSESSEFHEAFSGPQEYAKVTRLQPNTLYRVRLFASNQYGRSEYSDIIMVQTNGAAPEPPEPPQMLSANSQSLQLAWHKRVGDDSFTLYMEDPQSGHGFLAAVTTTETVSTVHGLTRNTEYRFRLIAQNDDGKSNASETVSYRTTPSRPQPPSRPFLKEKVRHNSLKLAWDPPKDTGGADITGYHLEYCSEAHNGAGPRNWSMIHSGPEREFLVTGLEPGTGYKFRGLCSSSGGQSSFSEPLSVTTTAVGPGLCKSPEVVGRVKPNSLSLKWGSPETTGGAEITEYELCMQSPESESFSVVFRGLRQDCVVGSLLPGRQYGFKVRAHNYTGAGKWSDIREATTAPGPPDPPRGLRLSAASTPHSLTLAWDLPQQLNGANVIEYRLLKAVRRIASLKISDSVVSSSGTEKDASPPASSTPSTPRKEETGGKGPASNPPSGHSSPPSSPAHSAVSDTPSMDTSEYGDFSQVFAGSGLSHEVKGLTPATDYAFRVSAANSAGLSEATPPLTCRTPPGPPDAPHRLAAHSMSTTEVTVNWEVPLDNGSVLSGYQMDVSYQNAGETQEETVFTLDLAPEATSHLLQDLLPETTYRLRLRGENEVGKGGWCQWVKVTTFSRPPPPPSLDLVAAGHNSLKLKWQDNKASTTNELYTYSLEVENKAGSFSPVYEGPSRSHKVPRLNECTKYRFRMRSSCATGGTGVWSETQEFHTTRAPPVGLKNPPKVTEVSGPRSTGRLSSWQAEWQGVKASGLPRGDKIHYCLQLTSTPGNAHRAPVTPTEEWKTMYRGSSQSYTLNGLQSGVSYRVRVFPVRLSPPSLPSGEEEEAPASTANWIETPGPAAMSGTFYAPVPETDAKTQEAQSAVSQESDQAAVPVQQHTFSDRQWAALILAGFSVLAIMIAFIIERFMMGAA